MSNGNQMSVGVRLPEPWRQNSDHRKRRAVHDECFANNAAVRAERRRPQSVAQHHYGRGRRPLLLRCEPSAENRLHAERWEKRGRHAGRGELSRLAVIVPTRGELHECPDLRKGPLGLSKELVVWVRVVELHSAAAGKIALRLDHDDAVGVGNGEARQQKRFQNGKRCGVGTDGEPHREHGDRRQCLAAREEAKIDHRSPRGVDDITPVILMRAKRLACHPDASEASVGSLSRLGRFNCLGWTAIPTSLALLRAGSFGASRLRMTRR